MRFIGSARMDRPPLGTWIKEYNMRYTIKDPEGVKYFAGQGLFVPIIPQP